MLKTIALIGLASGLVVPSVPAFAVSGDYRLTELRITAQPSRRSP